jgi:hypothetical protein
MSSFFFRVEHDLLRSEAFKSLGGSAIKVYLVIGLYSDFGTDWAYPSIRTIARQAGLSRQTVISAITELTDAGLLAASRSKGRSTAYRILREPAPAKRGQYSPEPARADRAEYLATAGPNTLDDTPPSGLETLHVPVQSCLETLQGSVQFLNTGGRKTRPNPEPSPKDHDTATIPIPGTPFRVTAQGRVLVAVDLQELLTSQGISQTLASRIVAQKDPEAVAKVLLNALYLESQGKLQNGPGYIRTGIEEGYELLPQVASRIQGRQQELRARLEMLQSQELETSARTRQQVDEAAINYVLGQLGPKEVTDLVEQAISLLPEPLVRHNRTLSNPFIRGKVYELACGEPMV